MSESPGRHHPITLVLVGAVAIVLGLFLSALLLLALFGLGMNSATQISLDDLAGEPVFSTPKPSTKPSTTVPVFYGPINAASLGKRFACRDGVVWERLGSGLDQGFRPRKGQRCRAKSE